MSWRDVFAFDRDIDADMESKLCWLAAFPLFEAGADPAFPEASRGWRGDRIIGAVAKSAKRVFSTRECVAAIPVSAFSAWSAWVVVGIPLASEPLAVCTA